MKVPISWLKDFVDIDLSIEELAHRLTLAGLEVEEIQYIGLPKPQGQQQYTRPYGGPPQYAPRWALHHSLDALRKL